MSYRHGWIVLGAATLGAFLLAEVVVVPATAQPPFRRDLVARFSSGLVIVEVDDQSASAAITRGTLSMSTDDARCEASPTRPCVYSVNRLQLRAPELSILGEDINDLDLVSSEAVPDQLDDGAGLRIRPVMPFWVYGRSSDREFAVFTVPEDGDALDILDLVVTPTESRASIFGRVSGRIHPHTVRITIMATVDSPFVNRPPVVDAGPDVTERASCVAEVRLTGHEVDDPDGNLVGAWWRIGHDGLATADQPVYLPPGDYDLTLAARDSYGALARDRRRLVIEDDGESEPVPGARVVRFEVPAGTDPERFAVAALDRLTTHPNARVLSVDRARGAAVASMGALELGVDTRVGDAFAGGSARLRNRAWIEGSLHVDGEVSEGRDVRIDGGVLRDGPYVPGRVLSFHTASPGDADIVVQPRGALRLEPGEFGEVEVRPGATLQLGPGVYAMESLVLAPGSVLDLSEAPGGPTIVAVSHRLRYHASTRSGGPSGLLLAFLGDERVHLHTAFEGSFVAPDADLVIGRAVHTGAFMARSVTLVPFAQVVHQPWDWNRVREARSACAIEPRFDCIRRDASSNAWAVFGYRNQIPHHGVVVPLGPFNRLEGTSAGYPIQGFWPRQVDHAFEVPIVDQVRWTLGGRRAIATMEGPSCAD